jgi:hypothetical protein
MCLAILRLAKCCRGVLGCFWVSVLACLHCCSCLLSASSSLQRLLLPSEIARPRYLGSSYRSFAVLVLQSRFSLRSILGLRSCVLADEGWHPGGAAHTSTYPHVLCWKSRTVYAQSCIAKTKINSAHSPLLFTHDDIHVCVRAPQVSTRDVQQHICTTAAVVSTCMCAPGFQQHSLAQESMLKIVSTLHS